METWLTRLSKSAKKEKRLVAGVISGTSVDMIKVAICEIASGGIVPVVKKPAKIQLKSFFSHPYKAETRAMLFRSLSLTTREVAELNYIVADEFSDAVICACNAAGITTTELDCIGSHGQTVYHHSSVNGAKKVTLQLGDGDVIAERCGVPVFFDFRARDIAAGGEGAPLTPYADAALFAEGSLKSKVILNLGGIANVTFLDSSGKNVIGFDTGPANGILDRLTRIMTNGKSRHDSDGKIALSGSVNTDLLDGLISDDSYISKLPPKSTGFESYGDDFVSNAISVHGAADSNLMATFVEFIAKSIAIALESFGPKNLTQLIVVGGGGKNPAIMAALQRNLSGFSVTLSDELGVPSAAREAMAFALFANDAILGIATSLPSVTGAKAPRVLGKLALPS